MTGIEAVVFDLFGTLVFEFPRADWDAWLETSAAVLVGAVLTAALSGAGRAGLGRLPRLGPR